MKWPIPTDYQDAVQNPKICFQDPELKAGTAALLPMGLPRVASGNFASVYEIQAGKKRWAVRCFLRQAADQQRHYAHISQHLKHLWLPYLVDFEYQQEGIRLLGQTYPIVKMQWVDGIAMHSFVKEQLEQPQNLLKLAAQWRGLVNSLHGSRLAHGDLQHGNVLVTGRGVLRLVDYDAMFVPTLHGTNCAELGHANYQHLRRTGTDYDHHLDNFSALVIYVSLRALAVEPALWQEFHTGENLIFSAVDFKAPSQSPVFQRLRVSSQGEVQSLAAELEHWCCGTVAQIGNFESVLSSLANFTLNTPPTTTQSFPNQTSFSPSNVQNATGVNTAAPTPEQISPASSTRWWTDATSTPQPARTQTPPVTATGTPASLLAAASGQSATAPSQVAIPGQVKINPVDGAEIIWIPDGDFLMGSDVGNPDEMPQHTVWISSFYLYKYPVTVAQYRQFCVQTGHAMPPAPAWGWKDLHPVVNVSWNDASRYCRWAKVALPTEAQWEKAGSGVSGLKYPWGNEWDSSKCANSVGKNSLKSTVAVGSYPQGASPYGVLDIAGNVWEWCSDWYDEHYPKTALLCNPNGPDTGSARVLRGSSWYFGIKEIFRCACRNRNTPDFRNNLIGFRCVVTADFP